MVVTYIHPLFYTKTNKMKDEKVMRVSESKSVKPSETQYNAAIEPTELPTEKTVEEMYLNQNEDE